MIRLAVGALTTGIVTVPTRVAAPATRVRSAPTAAEERRTQVWRPASGMAVSPTAVHDLATGVEAYPTEVPTPAPQAQTAPTAVGISATAVGAGATSVGNPATQVGDLATSIGTATQGAATPRLDLCVIREEACAVHTGPAPFRTGFPRSPLQAERAAWNRRLPDSDLKGSPRGRGHSESPQGLAWRGEAYRSTERTTLTSRRDFEIPGPSL